VFLIPVPVFSSSSCLLTRKLWQFDSQELIIYRCMASSLINIRNMSRSDMLSRVFFNKYISYSFKNHHGWKNVRPCMCVFVWGRNCVCVCVQMSVFVFFVCCMWASGEKQSHAVYGQASCRAAVGMLKEQLSFVLLAHWPLRAFPCQQDRAQSKALKYPISVCSWQDAVRKSPFPLVQGQFCATY